MNQADHGAESNPRGAVPACNNGIPTDLSQFRGLTDHLPQMVWSCLPDGRCDFVNRRWVEYTGVPETEHFGSGWLAALHPDDRPAVVALWTAFMAGQRDYDLEYRLRRHDGVYRWFKTRGLPLRDAAGAVVRIFGTTTDIDAQKRAEEELRESQERLAVALVASGTGTFRWDIVTNSLDWDTQLDRLFGLPAGQTTRSLDGFLALVHPDDRAEVLDRCRRCKEDGADFAMEFRVVQPDGAVRWLDDRGKTFRGPDGRPAYMTGACVDVTEHKRIEEALRETELRSRKILESVTDAFFAIEADWRFTYVNAQAERLLNRAPGTLLGQVLWDALPGLANSDFERACRRVALERVTESFTEFYPAHGRWYEVRVYPAAPDGITIYIRDVTDRHQFEERERQAAANLARAAEANAKFRVMFEQGMQFAGMLSPDGIVLECNRLWVEACGFKRAEVLGKPFWECGWWNRSPQLMAVVREAWQRAAGGELFRGESTYFTADGSEGVMDLALAPAIDDAGRVLFIAATGADVTDRKYAEQAFLEAREQSEQQARTFDVVLSSVGDPVYTFTPDGRFTYANKALLDLYGLSADQLIGKTMDALHYPEGVKAQVLAHIRQVVASRETVTGEILYTSPTGVSGHHEYILSPVFDTGGAVVAVAGSSRDVTDRKRAEEALREADRRKDDFLALLAHELRNPLAPLKNGLQVMRLGGDDPGALARALAMMERQLGHMVRLVDDLLDVSRISRNKLELRREPVTLAEVVESAIETARPVLDAASHTFTVALPTDTVYLDADLTRLAQVVSNLLTNAAKYTQPGGNIRLTACCSGDHVTVSVEDNGIGIPAEALRRIFDMFSQVERPIERSTGGLGIGLALVKGLTEMHGGSVTAHSAGPGKGSTFELHLPILDAHASPAAPGVTDEATPPGGRSRRILVADDNTDSAQSLALLLGLLGHDVRVVHDGLAAVEAAEQFGPEIILMDVGMPRLNGYEATRRIRTTRSGKDATVIAVTGWGQDEDRRLSKQAGCDGHLVKPVSLMDLSPYLSQEG